jgi:hypothetical protein
MKKRWPSINIFDEEVKMVGKGSTFYLKVPARE